MVKSELGAQDSKAQFLFIVLGWQEDSIRAFLYVLQHLA